MASSDEVFVLACADTRLARYRRACAKAARAAARLDRMAKQAGYGSTKPRKGRKRGHSNGGNPAR